MAGGGSSSRCHLLAGLTLRRIECLSGLGYRNDGVENWCLLLRWRTHRKLLGNVKLSPSRTYFGEGGQAEFLGTVSKIDHQPVSEATALKVPACC